MYIIGITGTLGAGKGTIVDYLVEQKGFSHFSVRGYLLDIIRERGLTENRDSMVLVANELRKKYGNACIVNELFEKAQKLGQNTVIESIRNTGEIDSLRQLGTFYLLAVDAEPQIRFERISKRRSETDHIAYQEFLDNEQREMTSTDTWSQNIRKCIEQADAVLTNNSDFKNLYLQLEQFLSKLML